MTRFLSALRCVCLAGLFIYFNSLPVFLHAQEVSKNTTLPQSSRHNLNALPGYQSLPTYVRYQIVYKHYVHLEDLSNRLDAEGKTTDAQAFRTYHQRAAGLNDAEALFFKQVVEDTWAKMDQIEQQKRDLLARIQSQRAEEIQKIREEVAERCKLPTSHCDEQKNYSHEEIREGLASGKFRRFPQSAAVTEMKQQVADLTQQGNTIVLDSIDLLKSQLPEHSFNRLDTWVNTFTLAKVEVAGPSRTGRQPDLITETTKSASSQSDRQ